MNFFEQQDRARNTTTRLVVLFVIAVAVLVAVTSGLAAFALTLMQQQNGRHVVDTVSVWRLVPAVGTVIVLVVLLGALYRTSQLSGGGKVIAEQMGGTLLSGHATALEERKILNVVEEMAIASGVPVPPVYVIEDDAINAFAAGYHPQDAVIGITRGAIRLLERDELQGVIAHEFSHIFNGDMRLNLRLIGWLHGLLLIALLGRLLLRSQRHVRSRGKNNPGAAIALMGVGFIILGYAGVLFGNLIKAAVSRQREFLADASAVQFTRNPGGIGAALKKIGGYALGSRLQASDTTEVSHLLFGDGVYKHSFFLFATHPPLEERIRRIDPQWDGKMLLPDQARVQAHDSALEGAQAAPKRQQGAGAKSGFAGDNVIEAAGAPTTASLAVAADHLTGIPAALKQQLATPHDASLVMLALLVVHSGPAQGGGQLQALQQAVPAESFRALSGCLKALQALPRELDLTLVELAQPALRQLSAAQHGEFMRLLQTLADTDGELSVQEWAMLQLLQHYRSGDTRLRQGRLSLLNCREECRHVLSVVALAGHAVASEAEAAFAAGWQHLALGGTATLRPDAGLAGLESVVARLALLQPLQKPQLLKALVVCVRHDALLSADEATLLRALAALLDCPLPPLA